MARFSSILERGAPYLGSKSDLSGITSLPPPSPSLRRSSTHDILANSRLRRSGTFDAPDNFRDRMERQRTPSFSREGSVYSRETSTPSYRETSRFSPKEPSFSREIPNYTRPTFSDEPSYPRDTPNYSRYSSILDDKHNWGFSTLRRRHSRNGYP
jgi:hypothetical protein